MLDRYTLDHKELPGLLGKTNPFIIEAGCNDGVDTVKMLEQMPDADIHCFEPVASARERWVKNLDGWRGATLYPSALGDYDGFIDFFNSFGDGTLQPEWWDYSGSIRRPKNHLKAHPWCGFRQASVKVPIFRMDTVIAWACSMNAPVVDFIWADVQGAEGDLIRGGRQTLERTRFLYTEYSNSELYEGQVTLKDIMAMLPGWEIVRQYTEDVLLRNTRWG